MSTKCSNGCCSENVDRNVITMQFNIITSIFDVLKEKVLE